MRDVKRENGREIFRSELDDSIVWAIIIVFLCIISFKHYLLFHSLVELFSVVAACIAFIIIWKSKSLILNRYLLLLGISYFFVGSFDLLHTLAFSGVEALPELDLNPSIQFWIIARYIESISLLIAPLFLIRNKNNEMDNSIFFKNSRFAKKIFVIYAIITAYLLISVIYLKNFPASYIEGSGFTFFEQISGCVISFILLCSLVLLYAKKDMFGQKVFSLLVMSITLAIFGELPFIIYSHLDEFPSAMGHFIKLMSFCLIYQAVVETKFEEPYSRLSRELTQREDVLKQEASFLTNEQALIYGLFGVKKDILEKKTVPEDSHRFQEDYLSFMHNFSGILFQLDKDLLPIFMEGSIEEITGYSKKDFLSGNVKWADIIIPTGLPVASKKTECSTSNPEISVETEYRIERKDGEIRWVRERIRQIPNNSGNRGKFQGWVHDITGRKMIEETLEKHEEARVKEIHHRIKNNLQVVSSLLDLQAERFSEREAVQSQEILKAFKESQNRVICMALIHEELYKSRDMATLDFASYLRKLTTNLLRSYTVKNEDITLKLNVEQVYLGMDTAIPLGIIVNELVSNSLKYAFQPGQKGEISISLCRSENNEKICEKLHEKSADSEKDRDKSKMYLQYTLAVADNGPGIPEEIDLENTDSLGLQLIMVLVDQIEGHLELRRDAGTEFKIIFNNK